MPNPEIAPVIFATFLRARRRSSLSPSQLNVPSIRSSSNCMFPSLHELVGILLTLRPQAEGRSQMLDVRKMTFCLYAPVLAGEKGVRNRADPPARERLARNDRVGGAGRIDRELLTGRL